VHKRVVNWYFFLRAFLVLLFKQVETIVSMDRKYISKYSESYTTRGISTDGDEMGTCTSVSGIFWSVYTLTHAYI
jgi:hypothetical protein